MKTRFNLFHGIIFGSTFIFLNNCSTTAERKIDSRSQSIRSDITARLYEYVNEGIWRKQDSLAESHATEADWRANSVGVEIASRDDFVKTYEAWNGGEEAQKAAHDFDRSSKVLYCYFAMDHTVYVFLDSDGRTWKIWR